MTPSSNGLRRRTLQVLFCFSLLVLSGCQQPSWRVSIRCATGMQSELSPRGSKPLQTAQELRTTFEARCGESLADLDPVFGHMFDEWRSLDTTVAAFDLAIVPWTAEREQLLDVQSRDLQDCRYSEFQRSAGWLILYERNRAYCKSTWATRPATLLPMRFGWYLMTHLSWTTAPYLIPYLMLAGALIFFYKTIVRRRSLGSALRPGYFTGALFVCSALLLWGMVWHDPAILIPIYLLLGIPQWFVRERNLNR